MHSHKMKKLLLGVGLPFLLLSLTACGSTTQYVHTGVPQALLDVCLTLPEATPPGTNQELAEGFLTAREGHETCRGVVLTIQDYFGEQL